MKRISLLRLVREVFFMFLLVWTILHVNFFVYDDTISSKGVNNISSIFHTTLLRPSVQVQAMPIPNISSSRTPTKSSFQILSNAIRKVSITPNHQIEISKNLHQKTKSWNLPSSLHVITPTLFSSQSLEQSTNIPSILSVTMNLTSTNTSSMIALGTTTSLVMTSLKSKVNGGFTSITDLQQAAKQRHVVVGVHTIIGLDSLYVEKLLGLNSSIHDYRIERMDRPEADCWMGNVFEYFDAVVSTDSYFTIMFRQNRDCYLAEKRFKSFSNVSNDMNIVNIGPYEVLMMNPNGADSTTMELVASQALYTVMKQFVTLLFIPQSLCNSYFIAHDYAVIRAGYGLVNLTQQDVNGFSYYFKNSMRVNHTYYDMALQLLKANISSNVFDSLGIQTQDKLSPQLSSMVFPASCYSCSTSQCMWEDRNSPTPSPLSDSIAISSAVFLGLSLLTYWPLLIIFRNKPSIRRRLIIPWVCPLFTYLIVLDQLFEVSKPCYMLHNIIIYFASMYNIVIYYTVMTRFTILRNLYTILRKCKTETQIKIVKFIVSKTFTITTALVLGFILSCVVALAPLATYREEFFGYNSQYVSSLVVSLISIIFAAASLFAVVVNVMFGIPTIKSKGMLYFLFFDDPFFIRFDAIFLTTGAILVAVSLFTSASMIPTYNGIVSFLTYALGFMYYGGVAIVFEILKILFFRAPNGTGEHWEQKLDDVSFMLLLKEFAEKEMSLENIYCYEKLKEMEKKSSDNNPRLSVSDLDFLYNNFMKPFCKNEINFSNETKKDFDVILSQCKKNEDVRYSSLKQIMMIPLMINIRDTYMRLVRTNEYRKWETAKSMLDGN
ncbi:hypothetical protein C9374_000364 [Naegleria lovaniensis]|uniref:RGS domain-containing protein n=1 Tax=Naegleria lovaniensis TaxID=51637 RepID=A0AA88GU50_NAELO|nr:uncharacterized protein C9374_000364 [Naegleria lovaniensis]KAG2388925.1 hypothetical protein C9374_000364 [Naegleria lovaniensis]